MKRLKTLLMAIGVAVWMLPSMNAIAQVPTGVSFEAVFKTYPVPMLMIALVLMALVLFGLWRKQKTLQHSLAAAKQQADHDKHVNRAKTAFVQNMSHDLRTPMTTILGMSEIIHEQQQDGLDDKLKLHHIHRSAQMLMTLIDDLSDITKIEQGEFVTEVKPFYLSQLVLNLQKVYSESADEKDIALQCQRLGTLNEGPDCFLADAKRISQVLFNLLGNAIKATEHGTIEFSVGLRQDKNDQAWLKFTVKDTGSGLSSAQQTELYQLFLQSQSQLLQQSNFGLNLSQILVQKLGGEGLQFQSELNEGSQFEFEVPVAVGSQADEVSLINQSITDITPLADPKSILLVEDNLLNQKIAIAFLKKMGLEATVAENGQQAVDLCQQHPFDLVLMDIHMPIMDGYEATQTIRQFAPNLPIIALTAAVMASDKAKAKQVGMNDHLSKPIVWEKFQQTLLKWLLHSNQPSAETDVTAQTVEVEQCPLDDTKDGYGQRQAFPTKDIYDLLIVDDVKENLRILANGLSDQYQIHIADRGYKALELAKTSPQPDLILLDVMMPDLDGFEVCRLLKNDPKTHGIPVIFVTALVNPNDEAKGLDLGAVDFISKPFNLSVIRSRVRSHLSLKIKTDLLEQMSHIDGLTHIANRRLFDERLLEEAKRHARNNQTLGLVMIDIDYFKPYNDHYGHGKGDECLMAVAQALKAVVKRPSDLLARYGGEEFVVILPDTDAEGVMQLAEKMRLAVSDLRVTHDYSKVADHVTISLGAMASQVESVGNRHELLKQADLALYRAKEAGRNQVKLSQWKPEA